MDPSLNGGLAWRGAQNGGMASFLQHILEERVSSTFSSEAECQVQRGKTLEDPERIHVIKEMTDESECWQRSKRMC